MLLQGCSFKQLYRYRLKSCVYSTFLTFLYLSFCWPSENLRAFKSYHKSIWSHKDPLLFPLDLNLHLHLEKHESYYQIELNWGDHEEKDRPSHCFDRKFYYLLSKLFDNGLRKRNTL